jgi:hypothetical protein
VDRHTHPTDTQGGDHALYRRAAAAARRLVGLDWPPVREALPPLSPRPPHADGDDVALLPPRQRPLPAPG